MSAYVEGDCPECGSSNVYEIDRRYEYSEYTEQYEQQQHVVCSDCDHDYWQTDDGELVW